MAHHLARLAEIGRRADIEPCAGNWEIAHFRTRPDSSGNEIGSIEPMLRHIIDQTVADQINAGIGIVGICGFFLYAGHPVAIDGKDGKLIVGYRTVWGTVAIVISAPVSIWRR